jgi:hypothetical protein
MNPFGKIKSNFVKKINDSSFTFLRPYSSFDKNLIINKTVEVFNIQQRAYLSLINDLIAMINKYINSQDVDEILERLVNHLVVYAKVKSYDDNYSLVIDWLKYDCILEYNESLIKSLQKFYTHNINVRHDVIYRLAYSCDIFEYHETPCKIVLQHRFFRNYVYTENLIVRRGCVYLGDFQQLIAFHNIHYRS